MLKRNLKIKIASFLVATLTLTYMYGINFNTVKAFATADLPGAHHATVGNDVFLGGNYIEVGVSKHGSFGTASVAPSGFHQSTVERSTEYYDIVDNSLGMVVDGDGFDIGEASNTGDFFLPGSPVEGYIVAYKNASETITQFNVDERSGSLSITDITTTDTSEGDTLSATTVGTTTDGKLKITQVVSFGVNDKYFNIKVTHENLSEETLYDVRYQRYVDPDQDADTQGDYNTKNSVTENPPEDNMAIVIAKGPVTDSAFMYISSDSRARAAIGSGSPYNTSNYDEDGSKLIRVETTQDTHISMTYAFGDIEPGASVTFNMSNSLNPNVDDAIGEIESPAAVTYVNPIDDITVDNGTDISGIDLPETIDVDLSDDTTTSAAVTWDNGDPDYDGNIADTYTFTGTLNLPDGVTNDDNLTATVDVIVQAADDETTTPAAVTFVNPIDDITVDNGTDLEDIGLPETIDVDLSDSTTTSAAVIWDNGNPTYNGTLAGTYSFTGRLSLPDGATNPDNLKASADVIVKAKHKSGSSSNHHNSSSNNTPDTKTNDNGVRAGWTQDTNRKWYLVNEEGTKEKGWNLVDNKWYFLDENNGERTIGWKLVDNKWYMLDKNSGSMVTGWYKAESGDWTYDGQDTVGQWFHLDADGKLTTGWLKDNDNNWYYLCDGMQYGALGVMKTGWQYIDNNWYYFNSNGAMASNTLVDGYTLGSDGALI